MKWQINQTCISCKWFVSIFVLMKNDLILVEEIWLKLKKLKSRECLARDDKHFLDLGWIGCTGRPSVDQNFFVTSSVKIPGPEFYCWLTKYYWVDKNFETLVKVGNKAEIANTETSAASTVSVLFDPSDWQGRMYFLCCMVKIIFTLVLF